ncbi:hypothetical protein MRX96_009141 [Rhipicephalus microplus]
MPVKQARERFYDVFCQRKDDDAIDDETFSLISNDSDRENTDDAAQPELQEKAESLLRPPLIPRATNSEANKQGDNSAITGQEGAGKSQRISTGRPQARITSFKGPRLKGSRQVKSTSPQRFVRTAPSSPGKTLSERPGLRTPRVQTKTITTSAGNSQVHRPIGTAEEFGTRCQGNSGNRLFRHFSGSSTPC